MANRGRKDGVKPRDRKLGDEWTDWNGETDPQELEIDEHWSTFAILAGVTLVIFVALLDAGGYLIHPRIEQFSSFAAVLVRWGVTGFGAAFLLLVAVETISVLKFQTGVFPYVWAERFLLALLPKTVWLGARFGISRDRVGNSFIKVHNVLIKAHAATLNADRLLILLPRCLAKEVRSQIMTRLSSLQVTIVTAAGGEEARKAIMEHRPTLILACACERDLVSGLRDVAEKVPVLAIPNKRPEGPCKNTYLQLEKLEEALTFIEERKGSKTVTVHTS